MNQTKNIEITNLNILPVQVVKDTSTRKIKNKRYPNETLEEREIRLKRRRLQEAKRREKYETVKLHMIQNKDELIVGTDK